MILPVGKPARQVSPSDQGVRVHPASFNPLFCIVDEMGNQIGCCIEEVRSAGATAPSRSPSDTASSMASRSPVEQERLHTAAPILHICTVLHARRTSKNRFLVGQIPYFASSIPDTRVGLGTFVPPELTRVRVVPFYA